MWELSRAAGVAFHRMLLIDDRKDNLSNEDGWLGLHVRRRDQGFRFADCEDVASERDDGDDDDDGPTLF